MPVLNQSTNVISSEEELRMHCLLDSTDGQPGLIPNQITNEENESGIQIEKGLNLTFTETEY
jgi:hypothetical protein